MVSRRWFILLMFMVAHAVNDGFGWIIPPLLPAIREHFQLSYTDMGGFYTLFRLFGSIFQAPAAYLVHLAPISTILVGGLLSTSVGMFVASLSVSYGALVWISAISGIGRSAYHPLAVTSLSRIFGNDTLGRAMGFHLSASSAGMVAGPFLVGLLLSRYGWRLPLQIWSTLGVLVGLGLFFFLKSQLGELQPVGKRLGWPFFSGSLGFYLIAISTWAITQSGLLTFLPLFLVDYRGFTIEKAAATYGIMSLAATLCRPFIGAVMDWWEKRKPVVMVGIAISSLSILAMLTIETSWLLYVFIVLVGIFGTGHTGLADTFMIEMIPSSRREETLGFVYTIRMGIAAVSPVLVGIASERSSLHNAFLILAGLGGLSVLLLSLTKERPVV
jgi:FSR family fosmidomycin resistance protein-like MFS transporter